MICPNLESERQKQSTVFDPIDFKEPVAFVVGFFWINVKAHFHVVPTLPLTPLLGGLAWLPIYIPN